MRGYVCHTQASFESVIGRPRVARHQNDRIKTGSGCGLRHIRAWVLRLDLRPHHCLDPMLPEIMVEWTRVLLLSLTGEQPRLGPHLGVIWADHEGQLAMSLGFTTSVL